MKTQKRNRIIAMLLTVSMVLSILLTGVLPVAAEGTEKYLELQKTDTAGTTITYVMQKNLQDFADGDYDAVTVKAMIKIDQVDGADGIEIFRSGSWSDYGYLRQDGEDGLKYVVKGNGVTNEEGEAVPAELGITGMKLGEWCTYEFSFGMQSPYTTTITIKNADGSQVMKAAWPDIKERGNLGMVFRTNTKVSLEVKNLQVIGTKDKTETVIEDRNYKETAEGAYYGNGTTDSVGGVDNLTRTSKLIALKDEPDPEEPNPPVPGSERYLELKKTEMSTTDGTYTMNYVLLKSLQNYADGWYDSVKVKMDCKVDVADGWDGIELFRSGSWSDYGYLRQDGEDGLKYVVKGSGVTNESGEAVPAETGITGMKLGEWCTYEFDFGMKSPYTTTITIKGADGSQVMKATWPDIKERGNLGMVFRANTKISLALKNIQIIGTNGSDQTIIEDRNFQNIASGNYYGNDVSDAVGGADGNTRTSKLIGADSGNGAIGPAWPNATGAVRLEERNYENYIADEPFTNSISLGDANKASAVIRKANGNQYLELKQTDSGNKLLYYAVKGLANYAQIYDSLILDAKIKMSDFTEDSTGVKIWTWAQTFGIFTEEQSKVNYQAGGANGEKLLSEGLPSEEWFSCRITFGFKNSKLKLSLYDKEGTLKGETEGEYVGANAGNFAFEFDSPSVGTLCLDDIVLTGVVGDEEDPEEPITQKEFYVSTDGNDSNDGTLEKPFKTIEKARDTVRRALANQSLEEGPITVNIRGGVYKVDQTISFGAADSGTAKNPVIYQAYEGEIVRFMGGIIVSPDKIVPVTDQEVLDRVIDPQARKKLVQIDLGALGITQIPQIDDHGFGSNMPASFQNYRPFEVYFNGQALTKSRYPNDEPGTGFLRTGDVLTVGSTTVPFSIEYKDPDNRTALWDTSKLKDLFISGFIGNDWAGVNHRVASLDTEKKQVTSTYGTTYSATANHRLYFWNLIEEIDMPGESYIDRDKKIIYFYPPSETKDAEVTVATFDQVMFHFNGCKNITLKDITCDTTRNRIINVSSCENVVIDGCTLARGSAIGVAVNGKNCTVKNCHIYEMGAGGVSVQGGDAVTLTPAANVIENNRIHSFNRVYNSSIPAIAVYGVGQIVRHNAVYDAPHILIQLNGAPDTLLEYNEIYNGVQEASDIGAVYWGRKPEEMGITIRYNYFHDIGNKYGGYGQQSVFYDDGAIGPELYGNVFYRGTLTEDQGGTTSQSFAVKTHGGQYGNIENNIFIDSPVAFRIQPWNNAGSGDYQTRWWLWMQNTVNPMTKIRSQVWLDHYKGTIWENCQNVFSQASYNEFKALGTVNPLSPTADQLNLAKKYAPETTHTFTNNVTIGVPGMSGSATWGLAKESNTMKIDTVEEGKTLFKDFDGKNFQLTKEGLAQIQKQIPQFKEIPFEQMGLASTVGGTAPAASNPAVKGVGAVGATLTADYQYVDSDGDLEGNSQIVWYISNADGSFERIPGKQGKELLVDASYVGRNVKFEVVPYDRNMMYGEAVVSAPLQIQQTSATDKAALIQALTEAEQALKGAVAGEEIGQYPQAAIDALKAAVAKSEEIANTPDALQYLVDRAAEDLNAAIRRFQLAQITPENQSNVTRQTINPLLRDTENWKTVLGNSVFQDGSLVISDDENKNFALANYKTEKYKNYEFSFKMKLEKFPDTLGDTWAGIYLRQGSTDSRVWDNNSGYMFDIKSKIINLQKYNGAGGILETIDNTAVEYGKEYLVTVGVYDLMEENKVSWVLTVDGETVYSKIMTDNQLYGQEGYIGFSAGYGTLTISPVYADKALLQELYAEAAELAETAVDGNGYGQYPQETLNDFLKVKEASEAILNDEDAAQYDVNQAESDLYEAMRVLRNSVGTKETITQDKTIDLRYDLPTAEFEVAASAKNVAFVLDKTQQQPEITVQAERQIGTISMNVPYGTSFSGAGTALWAPKELTQPSISVSGENVVAVQFSDEKLTSDRAIRIVLPGQADKMIGYIENGRFARLTKVISQDQQSAADAELQAGEMGYLKSGNDVVIWTKILTEVIALQVKVSPSPSPSVLPTSAPNIPSGPSQQGFVSSNPPKTEEQQSDGRFVDIKGHWAEADINEMAKQGIVSGVTATTFEPDRSITRAEFAALITRALKLTAANTDTVFTDVSSEAWYADEVAAAAGAGLMAGYEGYFRPDELITREEMAVVMVKAYVFRGKSPLRGKIDQFTDQDEISEWAKDYADQAVSVGLISGMGANIFAPRENATRAQVASIIKRLLNQ